MERRNQIFLSIVILDEIPFVQLRSFFLRRVDNGFGDEVNIVNRLEVVFVNKHAIWLMPIFILAEVPVIPVPVFPSLACSWSLGEDSWLLLSFVLYCLISLICLTRMDYVLRVGIEVGVLVFTDPVDGGIELRLLGSSIDVSNPHVLVSYSDAVLVRIGSGI